MGDRHWYSRGSPEHRGGCWGWTRNL